MSFCDHCAGQRFDRARVLRVLRTARRRLRRDAAPCGAVEALDDVIREVRGMEIPHLESLEEMGDDTVVH